MNRRPRKVETWRSVENALTHVRYDWEPDVAEGFIAHVASVVGHEPKPLVIKPLQWWWGFHCSDEIVIADRAAGPQKWRVLIHECAHYRIDHHRREFRDELRYIHELWKSYLATLRDSGFRLPRWRST